MKTQPGPETKLMSSGFVWWNGLPLSDIISGWLPSTTLVQNDHMSGFLKIASNERSAENRTVTWAKKIKNILGQKRIGKKTMMRNCMYSAPQEEFVKYKQTLGYKSENCFKPVEVFEFKSTYSWQLTRLNMVLYFFFFTFNFSLN